MEDDLKKNKKMEDALKKKMEYDLIFFLKNQNDDLKKMEDDLKKNGRRTNQPKSTYLAVTPL